MRAEGYVDHRDFSEKTAFSVIPSSLITVIPAVYGVGIYILGLNGNYAVLGGNISSCICLGESSRGFTSETGKTHRGGNNDVPYPEKKTKRRQYNKKNHIYVPHLCGESFLFLNVLCPEGQLITQVQSFQAAE